MLAQPIPTPAPKKALSLPEPTVQSQENVQPQYHMPIPLPQHQTVDPTCTTQPIGPKYSIDHLHLTTIHTQDLHQDLLMSQIQ